MIYGIDNHGNVIETYNFNVIFSGNIPMSILLQNNNVKYILFTIENYPYSISVLFNKLKKNNIVFVNDKYVLIRYVELERMRACKFKSFKELVSFVTRFYTCSGQENEVEDIEKIDNKLKTINFFGITNTLGMPNRGPIIQTEFKKKYFSRDIKSFNIIWNSNLRTDWIHILNPGVNKREQLNVSIGPNIFLNQDLPYWCKNKYVVADSEWMKEHISDLYRIDRNKISVVPIYVSEEFYNTNPEKREHFTVGVVGYYQDNDVKNFTSLVKICSALPNVRFEVLSSRNKEQFPNFLRYIPNLHFLNVPHDKVHEYMMYWDCYLGMSKRERGPAVIQELRVLGIPTICANHTGYKEFKPLIPLDIQPFKQHSDGDISLFVDAIKDVKINNDRYREMALEDKKFFWATEKSTKNVSKKWENFFKKCMGV